MYWFWLMDIIFFIVLIIVLFMIFFEFKIRRFVLFFWNGFFIFLIVDISDNMVFLKVVWMYGVCLWWWCFFLLIFLEGVFLNFWMIFVILGLVMIYFFSVVGFFVSLMVLFFFFICVFICLCVWFKVIEEKIFLVLWIMKDLFVNFWWMLGWDENDKFILCICIFIYLV